MSLKQTIHDAIMDFEAEDLKSACNTGIESGEASAVEVMGMIGDVLKEVGDLFEQSEFFLPELVLAADVVKETFDEVLEPAIEVSGEVRESLGKVVIGTVEGDVHSIGKDLIGSFLFANGFQVYNLGVEVPVSAFIEKAEEVGADVIGASALLSMTMEFQAALVKELQNRGLREKYKVIVGGSSTSKKWAEKIGADGQADDPMEAVILVKALLGIGD